MFKGGNRMKVCEECGKDNNQDSNFCNSCGNRLDNDSIETNSQNNNGKKRRFSTL